MKNSLIIIFVFFTGALFSQDKGISKSMAEISKADTVYFVADNSGCFNAYILEVKMCKQKRGDRKLIMRTDSKTEEKKISAKEFKTFMKNYENSVNHFIGIDNGKCTSITEFDLYRRYNREKTTSVKFKNTTCEAEFNPEMFLQNLLRVKTGVK
ncbi:MAG: hypothetical protein J0L69_01400 [Bacteroidetes bacterium]|nr:hypothetical protein [Bacteroidota bacterium]